MSLLARFAILLALLAAAVIANLAVSVWAVGLLDREQRWANEQIGTVLGPLHRINRGVWSQSRLLGSRGIGWFEGLDDPHGTTGPSPQRDAEQLAEFRRLNREAIEAIDELEKFASYALRAGVNTTRNLRDRLVRAEAMAGDWFAGDDAARASALRELYEMHELIERLEARLIEDARHASVYNAGVRRRLIYTVVAAVSLVVAAMVVAAWLFRRWVVLKTERLQLGADRLGAGDFEHRIPVEGNDELDRVAQRINSMAGTILAMQAERIERERLAAIGEMARRVAHNIRNPLAGIRSLAELSALEAPAGSTLAEHQQRIIRTVDRFGSWLTELLSLSTPAGVELRPEQVRPWLSGLADALRPMAENRGVTLTIDQEAGPEVARMDQRHLEQAVSAIITNAIEVSPRGGRVTVTVRSDPPGSWRILVEDEGPGISEEAKGRLFRPYFTTKKGGTGIGLALAQRVVSEHGGRLEARNRAEEAEEGAGGMPGALFQLVLPLESSAELARVGQK